MASKIKQPTNILNRKVTIGGVVYRCSFEVFNFPKTPFKWRLTLISSSRQFSCYVKKETFKRITRGIRYDNEKLFVLVKDALFQLDKTASFSAYYSVIPLKYKQMPMKKKDLRGKTRKKPRTSSDQMILKVKYKSKYLVDVPTFYIILRQSPPPDFDPKYVQNQQEEVEEDNELREIHYKNGDSALYQTTDSQYRQYQQQIQKHQQELPVSLHKTMPSIRPGTSSKVTRKRKVATSMGHHSHSKKNGHSKNNHKLPPMRAKTPSGVRRRRKHPKKEPEIEPNYPHQELDDILEEVRLEKKHIRTQVNELENHKEQPVKHAHFRMANIQLEQLLSFIRQTFDPRTHYTSMHNHTMIQSDSMNRHQQRILQGLTRLDFWDFDIFALHDLAQEDTLLIIVFTLFTKYQLFSAFDIDDMQLVRFIRLVLKDYHQAPYHSPLHAADALHVMHCIISSAELYDFLSDNHILGSFLACIILDSVALERIKTDREQHESRFRRRRILSSSERLLHDLCIKSPTSNIFANCSFDQSRDIMACCSEMLMAIDRSYHANILHNFRQRLDSNADFRLNSNIILVLQVALRIADLSYPLKPEYLYLRWTERVFYEFYLTDVENHTQSLSTDVLQHPIMKQKEKLAKGQIGLIRYVVEPLVEYMARLLPKMNFALNQITQNKYYWVRNNEENTTDKRPTKQPSPPKKITRQGLQQNNASRLSQPLKRHQQPAH